MLDKLRDRVKVIHTLVVNFAKASLLQPLRRIIASPNNKEQRTQSWRHHLTRLQTAHARRALADKFVKSYWQSDFFHQVQVLAYL